MFYNRPLPRTCPSKPILGVELMPHSPLGGIRRFSALLALGPAAVFVAWLGAAADGGGNPSKAGPPRPGRTPWTTSRVLGSPDPPPPFKVVHVFPNLKFDHPLLIARFPGSD